MTCGGTVRNGLEAFWKGEGVVMNGAYVLLHSTVAIGFEEASD